MKNITEHTGLLKVISRLPSSVNGNPRYLVTVGDTTCRTAVDSSHGYSITNYEGKMVKATIGLHYNNVTLDSIDLLENQ